MTSLLQVTTKGLYCSAGDFYIDPWRSVDRAVITHGHSDHARFGSRHYLAAHAGLGILKARLGREASIQGVDYAEKIQMGEATVSLHPAGHILGSAQVRVECGGEIWVASGDYKTQPDDTCAFFEPIKCHTFITESTFGLPIYRWKPPQQVFADVDSWWRHNQTEGVTSVLFAYALGKAQRILKGIDSSIGPLLLHGAVDKLVNIYRESGVVMPPTEKVSPETIKAAQGRALVIAPPSAQDTPWLKKLAPHSLAFASGWMQMRGARQRRNLDRGFVLSDHADWPGLNSAIEQTGASCIKVTHGYKEVMVRWLKERGLQAQALTTAFEDDEEHEEILPTLSGAGRDDQDQQEG